MPTVTLLGTAAGTGTANPPVILDAGVSVQLTPTALAAASAAPNTTPQTPSFTVQPRTDGGDRTVTFSAVGVGGLPTTVTANVLASYDGGVTWQTYATALPLFAAGVGAMSAQLHLVSGPIYAVSLSTLALGPATGVNIVASAS